MLDPFRAPFWAHHPLRVGTRRVLLGLVAVVLIVDSLLRATSTSETPLLRAIVGTGIIIVTALFAWRPPVATVALMGIACIAAVSGVAGDYVIGAALLLGVVAATCSAALTAVYAAVTLTWVIIEVVQPAGVLEPAGAVIVGVLGAVSLLIGVTIRQQHSRWRRLSARIEENEREIAEQLRHERELIADELHDIVAHEITIVALHAAVLERTDDTRTRLQSQTAIREAAVQALTDIRRVLGMVRGEESPSPERVPAPESLESTIGAVVKELDAAGIHTAVSLPDRLRLPNTSLLALIRVIRESSTNVLKHATGARHVRIALTVERGWAHLEFADDSPPAQTAGLPASGYGIVRLQERFRLFGGTFTAERAAEGWVVTASLPLSD
nr:histidine kinase [Microbacterium invictum]